MATTTFVLTIHASSSSKPDLVKMPTAPWMTTPLLLPSSSKPKPKPRDHDHDKDLTARVDRGRTNLAVNHIIRSLANLKLLEAQKRGDSAEMSKKIESLAQKPVFEETKIGEKSKQIESLAQKRVFKVHKEANIGKNSKKITSLPQKRVFEVDEEAKVGVFGEELRKVGSFVEEPLFDLFVGEKLEGKSRKLPWVVAKRKMVFRREKKVNARTLAEMEISEEVLVRLREEAGGIKRWVKAKKAGVTDDVVEEIRTGWRRKELVMVRFVEPLRRNMDRAREILETKTGGLVVWKKNDALVVYRGDESLKASKSTPASVAVECKEPLCKGPLDNGHVDALRVSEFGSEIFRLLRKDREQHSPSSSSTGVTGVIEDMESVTGTLYEREADRLLDGLGPRFIDWWWPKPLPVDADLLPEVIPNYKPPDRRCPGDVKLRLADAELTYLRKLARPLPTHFALGKNTKLQGLADSILKLWEKSVIAKIAIKRGIPNTNNALMADELKRLTGGVLILRNKFYIILYRGKDFLPKGVASEVFERESQLENFHSYEEQAREKAVELIHPYYDTLNNADSVGSYTEFESIRTSYSSAVNANDENVRLIAEKERLGKELKKQEFQLSIMKLKIERSEKELMKLNAIWRPSEQAVDHEMLTDEERRTFQKIGLKMKDVLMLGRRGVYDGIIGSVHLHWKHRELVKVVTMQTRYSQVMDAARVLEAESGGILVTIEKLRTGHAIILYRGKNYKPPPTIFPTNLPSTRQALQRSIELQRRGSLKFFAHRRERSIQELKLKIRSLQERTKEQVHHIEASS